MVIPYLGIDINVSIPLSIPDITINRELYSTNIILHYPHGGGLAMNEVYPAMQQSFTILSKFIVNYRALQINVRGVVCSRVHIFFRIYLSHSVTIQKTIES